MLSQGLNESRRRYALECDWVIVRSVNIGSIARLSVPGVNSATRKAIHRARIPVRFTARTRSRIHSHLAKAQHGHPVSPVLCCRPRSRQRRWGGSCQWRRLSCLINYYGWTSKAAVNSRHDKSGRRWGGNDWVGRWRLGEIFVATSR